ncbi:MAG: ABC transporter ATP-binding protein [Spirochaetes bacterium]|nr:ABC transporter ATP-binding protein [Spirochaetota bacterium]MBU1081234.1 ABC transporter ATP-binding protein [Spirochaetota bacterium]
MAETVIAARNLRVAYPGFELKGVTFTMGRGEVLGFIGPNGAGKTTVIRCLMGIIPTDAGQVSLFGGERPELARRRVGFVSDDALPYGVLTTAEAGRLLAPLYPAWDESRFAGLLADFDIAPGKPIDTLSKGQKVKLSLALALARDAELLVMDEPTSGLDPVFRSELLDLQYGLIQDERRSVLFSTHITADIERIADRVLFIRGGAIVLDEPKDDLLARHCMLKGPADRLGELADLVVGSRTTGSGFTALSGIEPGRSVPEGFVREPASLEDIIVYSSREDYRAKPVA